jgi:hypothetical protein
LFVVPLANNNHGKSTLVRALLAQGLGAGPPQRKGTYHLRSPWGRRIDSLVYIRSFEETEKNAHETVEASLEATDSDWHSKELIIFPSHLVRSDVRQMVQVAHANGFDAVSAAVILNDAERENYTDCWRVPWDQRWNLPNPETDEGWEQQVGALACDLWTWICGALTS